jgi:endoglucanase
MPPTTPIAEPSPSRPSRFASISVLLLTLSLFLQAGAARLHAEGWPLIENPGFLIDNNNDAWPDGWLRAKGLTWHSNKAPELSYVRVKIDEPGKSPVFYREIILTTTVRSVDFNVQARATDVIPGGESWHDARLQLEFRNADKTKIRPTPKPLIVSRSGSVDWKSFSGTLEVPPGAASLVIVGALFYCQGGTLDIGLIELKARE